MHVCYLYSIKEKKEVILFSLTIIFFGLIFKHVVEKNYKHLTIDWALKTKLRLMSTKPFPWTNKLKASEEASGITG